MLDNKLLTGLKWWEFMSSKGMDLSFRKTDGNILAKVCGWKISTNFVNLVL